MLTIFSGARGADCSGISRRNFLRVGALGIAGMTLPHYLALKASAAEGNKFLSDKSVVFLFLNGGPSQLELFDPKMTAPVEIRSLTGEVQTSIPGVTYGGTFPKLAALAHQTAVVRSFKTANGNHDGGQSILSGNNTWKAAMGSVFARIAGPGNASTGIPNNVFLSPHSVGVAPTDSPFNYTGVFATGSLPSMLTAFHPTADGNSEKAIGAKTKIAQPKGQGLLADMQLRVDSARFQDRRELLAKLDDLRRNIDDKGAVEDLDKYQRQAYDVIVRGVSKAFDLKQEDPQVIAQYDTSHIRTPEALQKKLPQTKAHSPIGLGRQMLLARRLCEAGCGFVTVGQTGWDMHANNGFGIEDGMAVVGRAVDHAVSAFIQDVSDRGLSDKILLVIAGEMGRTPKINSRTAKDNKEVTRAGRDHWANSAALLLFGGGLPMGQVIGASDRTASAPATTPYSLSHLHATIMHTLFNVGELRITRGLPTDIVRAVTDGSPIKELIS